MSSRHEALPSRTGKVVLVTPLSFVLMALMAVASMVVLGLYMGLGQYTASSRVVGVLTPESSLLTVTASEAGMVAESRVRVGQEVKAGEALLVLTPLAATSASADAGAQQQARLAELTDRLLGLKGEHDKLGERLNQQQKKLATARAEIKRLRSQSVSNSLSDASLQEKLDQVLALRAEILSIEKKRERAAQDMTTTQALAARLGPSPATATARAATPRQWHVTAPADGTVTEVMAEPGKPVSSLQALVTLTPVNARLEAQLYVSPRAVASVQSGQKVQLRYRALPSQAEKVNEGTVIDVSLSPTPSAELPGGLSVRDQALHRVRVSLARQTVLAQGKPQRLSAGMQVEADILQGSRRLIQWAFEPPVSTKGTS